MDKEYLEYIHRSLEMAYLDCLRELDERQQEEIRGRKERRVKSDLVFVGRIDRTGRITIPREIRKRLLIMDYDSFEIFIDRDSIVLKKRLFTKELRKQVEYLKLMAIEEADVFDPDKASQIFARFTELEKLLDVSDQKENP